MGDRNIVVTVRLSDVDEVDQPDPICLPAGELATWRHFEALLQSMYIEPPSAIKVCYLDDESDWIEVSSDTELKEAIRVAQSTDEILQLQVKRKDTQHNTYFESTLTQPPTPVSVGLVDSHVTPLHTTYFNSRDQQRLLEYPHPTTTSYYDSHGHYIQTHVPDPACVYPLVYPHPNPSNSTEADAPASVVNSNTRPNENVLMMEANGRSAFIQNRPDLSTEEKVNRLKARLSSHTDEGDNLKGLNSCLSLREMFQQASGLSSEEKIKFMKTMVANDNVEKEPKTKRETNSEGVKGKILCSEASYTTTKPPGLIEPLSPADSAKSYRSTSLPPQSSLAVQDPFEVVCHDKPSRDLEQTQLNLQPGKILQPEKPRDSTTPPKISEIRVVEGEAAPPTTQTLGNGRPPTVSVAPIPLLHSLQMMVGAQSGANAVAIEIPEGDHHGAAQKEDDVTACGGAACTSASAETGEVVNTRTCHDGAAVGDKVKEKSSNGNSCSSDQAIIQPADVISGTKSISKKGKKSSDTTTKTQTKETNKCKSKKEASVKEAKKDEKKRVKDKEVVCCHHKASKEKACCSSGGDVKIVADVESGEKIMKKKKSSKSSMLHTKDFVKFITKMQTELHTGIVKDVGRQTDKLLKRTFSRSASCDSSLSLAHNSENFEEVVHRGIYCDSCNCVITGIRFKCGNCADFDYCEKCEVSNNNHDPSHVFLKLRHPVTKAGKVDGKNVPLLREIIYKKNSDSASKEFKKSKIESLEDVPILSISEVTTPGRKESPPGTPSDAHKKADIGYWVWDSTFDTDNHLYPVEGESGAGHSDKPGHINALTPESLGANLPRFNDSEMKRLYELLTIEAEAAKGDDNAGDHGRHDLIVELPKLTSVPEMAESLHSLTTLPTTNSIVGVEEGLSLLSPPLQPAVATTTTASETSVEAVNSAEVIEAAAPRESDEGHDEQPTIDWKQDEEDSSSLASSVELVEDGGDEEDEEGDGDFIELEGDVDENGFEEADEGEEPNTTHQQELHSDSDTSDDFCILNAGEIEDEETDDKKLLLQSTEVPSTEIVDHVRAEGEAICLAANVVDTAQVEDQNCDVVAVEEIPVVEEKIEACEGSEQEKAVLVVENEVRNNDGKEEGKLLEASVGNVEVKEEERKEVDVVGETSFTQEDVLMKMSIEERCRFLEMVKSLKERAEDLECELKARKEAEAEQKVEKDLDTQYQIILEEKQKEAVRENEKLELIQRKKELEERSKRSQRLAEKEKERKQLRQKKTKELKSVGGSGCGEGAKKKTRTSNFGSKPTLMQMALNGKDGRETNCPEKPVAAGTVTPSSLSGQSALPSAAKQAENVVYIRSEKRDADCQTHGRGVGGADAAAQASQMIQNVASGVSKAAEAAFHTAKDVFYSLQAKQVEKKMYGGVAYTKTTPVNSKASSTDATTTTTTTMTAEADKENNPEQDSAWVPPSSVWTPPPDTFVPPKSEWTPPKSDWKPPNVNWVPPKSEWTGPKSEWTGPKSKWTPPQGYYQPPSRETKSEDSSSVVTATAAAVSTATSSENQTLPPGTEELTKETSDTNGTYNDESKKEGHAEVQRSNSNPAVTASFTPPSMSSYRVSLPPNVPIQIADPVLRREVQGMQLLIEMGFANREQNRRLLQEHDGDVEKVVQSLLQEERDEHWSWQRH